MKFTTTMEHNSVLRPLRWLERERLVRLTMVTGGPDGRVDPDDVKSAVTADTALVVMSQASNVCGAVQDVAAVGAFCRTRGVPLLVDAAQSAGAVDIDLDRDGIDLLDLDRIASFVTDGAATTQAATRSTSRSACTYAADPTAVEFNPAGASGLPDIKAKRATIKETLALLDEILPEALTGFDLCTTIVDGELVYDHAAAAAHLRGQDLKDHQIASLLTVNALARFLDAYLFVTEDVTTQTTWYRLADGSIGVCADDEEALETQARDAVDDIGQSLLSLDLRSRTFAPGSSSSEIVTLAVDAFEEIRDAVGEYCGSTDHL